MKYINRFIRWLTTDYRRPNEKPGIDTNILFSVIILLTIGIVMVYSASIAYAAKASGTGNQYYYLFRHIISIALAIVGGILAFSQPTELWKKYSHIVITVTIVLLIAVLIPHVGKLVNGSRRWIPFGIMNLQPSEIAKIGIAIYLSAYMSREVALNKLEDIWQMILAIVAVCTLLLLEPDMGSTTVVFLIALTILFLSGLDIRVIWGMVGVGVIGFAGLVIAAPYRLKRVLGFLDPFQDALGKGYQLSHSLLAFGHGGFFGVGLGNSIEKLYYLPEAHTDFIMAIIGEEFGFIGVAVILILFWIIFYRGFIVIATDAKTLPNRKFQSLLAHAISTWFFAQAIVNIGVAIGMLPTKGLTLPFVSFGGSSILINCISLAILLRIDYENKMIRAEQKQWKKR